MNDASCVRRGHRDRALLREAHHAQVFRLLAQDLEARLTVEAAKDRYGEGDELEAVRKAWSEVGVPSA